MTQEEEWGTWIKKNKDEIVGGFTIMGWCNRAFIAGWNAAKEDASEKAGPVKRCGTCRFYSKHIGKDGGFCRVFEAGDILPSSVRMYEEMKDNWGGWCPCWKRKEG